MAWRSSGKLFSESVILGFMAGDGFLIALGQIGNFVGAAKKGKGDQSVLTQTWETLGRREPNPFGGAFKEQAVSGRLGSPATYCRCIAWSSSSARCHPERHN
jgi:hypothetical protein